MPWSYSNDLRWRIVWHHVCLRKPAEDVAKTLFVSERTVLRYVERFNATGQVEKTVRRNGCCSKLSESDKYLLIDLILSNPGIFLRELQAELQKAGCHVDVSTICRAVNKIGLSRQTHSFSKIRVTEGTVHC